MVFIFIVVRLVFLLRCFFSREHIFSLLVRLGGVPKCLTTAASATTAFFGAFCSTRVQYGVMSDLLQYFSVKLETACELVGVWLKVCRFLLAERYSQTQFSVGLLYTNRHCFPPVRLCMVSWHNTIGERLRPSSKALGLHCRRDMPLVIGV